MNRSAKIPYGAFVKEALNIKRTKNEQLRIDTLNKAIDVLDELRKIIQFKEVIIFGTIIKPYKFGRESDIDFAFIGLKDEDFFFSNSYLSQKLNREVDILQLESSGRLKSIILKEGLKWKKRS